VASTTPDLGLCNTGIPASFFGTYDITAANVTIIHDTARDKLCNRTGEFYFTYKGLDYADLPRVENPAGRRFPRRNLNATKFGHELCDEPCSSSADSVKVRGSEPDSECRINLCVDYDYDPAPVCG
jgi:hypothetical protein